MTDCSAASNPIDTNAAFSPSPPQRCLQLEPYNEVCQYMRGLSHVAMGQFYEGIKAQTKVMLNDPLPGQKASPEYLKVKYLRGESRKRPSLNSNAKTQKTHCLSCCSRPVDDRVSEVPGSLAAAPLWRLVGFQLDVVLHVKPDRPFSSSLSFVTTSPLQQYCPADSHHRLCM